MSISPEQPGGGLSSLPVTGQLAAQEAAFPGARARSGLGRAFWWGLARSILALMLVMCALEGILGLIPPTAQWVRQRSLRVVAEPAGALVILGDSVPYGYGVAASASFPGYLDRWLGLEGQVRFRVENRARPAAVAQSVLHQQLEAPLPRPAASSAVVLMQVGHNDFLGLDGLSRDRQELESEREALREARPLPLPLPRLTRMVGALAGVMRGGQRVSNQNPEQERRFVAFMRQIIRKVKGDGGRPYALTYVLPGLPAGLMTDQGREVLQETRRVQGRANQLIRQVAEQEGAGLLDLETLVPAPALWSKGFFLDNIHLTAKGNEAVAQAVWDGLAAARELPAAQANRPDVLSAGSRPPPTRLEGSAGKWCAPPGSESPSDGPRGPAVDRLKFTSPHGLRPPPPVQGPPPRVAPDASLATPAVPPPSPPPDRSNQPASF